MQGEWRQGGEGEGGGEKVAKCRVGGERWKGRESMGDEETADDERRVRDNGESRELGRREKSE